MFSNDEIMCFHQRIHRRASRRRRRPHFNLIQESHLLSLAVCSIQSLLGALLVVFARCEGRRADASIPLAAMPSGIHIVRHRR